MLKKPEIGKMDKNITKLEWGIAIAAIIIPFFSFLGADANSITRWGIDVLKSIFDGQFFNYYEYGYESYKNGLMVHPPDYDMTFIFTMGIWEAPIAIIELISGKILQHNILTLIYSKSVLLVFLFLSAEMVKKIAMELKVSETNAKWAEFMFVTTGLVLSYVCVVGQYDILGIFFSLAGVYFYIKQDMKKFVLMFIIAVQYKYFPLLFFIPLLLLQVKKIWKIMLYTVLPIAAVFLIRLPFYSDAEVILAKSASEKEYMLGKIFGNRIPILHTEVPLSFLLVGAVCIFCYLKEVKEEERGYYAVYIPFLTMGAFFLSCPFDAFWLIYITPWIPILYFMRKDLEEKYFWIETGMVVSILVAQYAYVDYVFDIEKAKDMILDRFIYKYDSFTNPVSVGDVMGKLGLWEYKYLLYGLYILCLSTMLILYRPIKNMEYKSEEFNSRKVLWARFGIQYAVVILPLFLYIISIFRELIFY